MTRWQRAGLASALLTVLIFGFALPGRADVLTSPGGFQVGIFRDPGNGKVYGTLNDTNVGVGFRRPDGFDPYIVVPRDAYGIKAGPFSGYADPNNSLVNPPSSGGVFRIEAFSPPAFSGSSVSIQTFLVNGAGVRVVQIDQAFSFRADNVLKIATTLTNLTDTTRPGGNALDLPLLFRRVTNFTFSNPDNVNDIVTVDPLAGFVTDATPRSFGPPNITESPNPLTGPFVFSTSGGTFGEPDGDELGAGMNLDLGVALAVDDPSTPEDERVKSFNYYYAVNRPGQTEEELRAQLALLGINYVISGRDGNRDAGLYDPLRPLGAAVGTEFEPVPEPGTVALLGLGVAGLIGYRWRKRRN
jgi:hypothetical protein